MTEIKTAYNPNGQKIYFDENKHEYKDENGLVYQSSTSFIGQFFPKFDMLQMAQRCSIGNNPKYTGRAVKDILAEWQKEGERGRNEGTNIHLYAESLVCSWDKKDSPVPISERCEKIFKTVDAAVEDLQKYYTFIGAEVIVFDPELNKSGMIDLLMYSEASNEIVIFDWKQNKTITNDNQFQKALEPISYIEDTDISHYSLQLSFYEYLLERNNYFPGVSGFRRALIHLKEDEYNIINLSCYKNEIKRMLAYEKKERI